MFINAIAEENYKEGELQGIKNVLEYLYFNRLIDDKILTETIFQFSKFLASVDTQTVYNFGSQGMTSEEFRIAHFPIARMLQSEQYMMWKREKDLIY